MTPRPASLSLSLGATINAKDPIAELCCRIFDQRLTHFNKEEVTRPQSAASVPPTQLGPTRLSLLNNAAQTCPILTKQELRTQLITKTMQVYVLSDLP